MEICKGKQFNGRAHTTTIKIIRNIFVDAHFKKAFPCKTAPVTVHLIHLHSNIYLNSPCYGAARNSDDTSI